MSKNVEAIRAWVRKHRPDDIDVIEHAIAHDGLFAMMAISFEAGREYQRERMSRERR